MLTIRKKHMEVFESATMRTYENRVLRAIEKSYPERYDQEGEERMRTLVQAGVPKGESYGITADDDAESYILVLVERGVDFEQEEDMAECRDILEKKGLPGDAKVSLIRRILKSKPCVAEQGLTNRQGG